jgi:hypothetical protein
MQLVIARNGVTKQSNYIECLQIMRLLHFVRNDVFLTFHEERALKNSRPVIARRMCAVAISLIIKGL